LSSGDGLVEAFAARPVQGHVLAVQWHPEWNSGQCATSRSFFSLIGRALIDASDEEDLASLVSQRRRA
jgi:putative glutamine amidotransferase